MTDTWQPRSITYGDSYNLQCPNCGTVQHYVANGIHVPHDRVVRHKMTCLSCQAGMIIDLQWALSTKAEIE